MPHALVRRLVQIDPLEAHDGAGPGGEHRSPTLRIDCVGGEDLVGIERQDDARWGHHGARVPEQQELAVALVEFVGRVVDDRDLGKSAADGAALVGRALVGDDDVVREAAGDRQEPLEDPRLVAHRRDHDDADWFGHGGTIRRHEGLRHPNRIRILLP